jgi:hypothetical protein
MEDNLKKIGFHTWENFFRKFFLWEIFWHRYQDWSGYVGLNFFLEDT